ncbi:Glucosamine-phosphate N-acetyltransferase-like protein [Coemansia spiralis]|uniref:Glucosamine 6-phosphate N-acetyltransferase n=2 Tax=Coemansia TaxID=4863 RepID=A0A9W8G573_9FUNG|nr:acyl-CoA N-acyltransferase [Coemansia spiralis]KAJ1988905.1 Glucosamine-phosphate N-acetyltransferase-like protein [Coemansia umbellata]KAJ2620006.1 Glucosamine-phosphate N-acetyltransferase-like protein [Coemansia sp. RSA 1358]KAJ2672490.1 Glucosamine-phosphate N-acetyltransferase-like protein [Coemansia spiralis]
MVSSNALFDSSVLGSSMRSQLPPNHVLRALELTDFNKGYMECLANLTITGTVTGQMFADSFEEMQRAGCYFVIVIEDLEANAIVASGTLVVEQKFLRGCGRVGHIEDIVVAKGQQGKRFGFTIIKQLLEVANVTGCYKSILDCSLENVPFYEKCGFVNKGIQMAIYSPDAVQK